MTLLEMLKKMEWKEGLSGTWCPICMEFKHKGHAKDCLLAEAIADAEKVCEWKPVEEDDISHWESTCGQSWSRWIQDEPATSGNHIYCPYCGHKIVEKKA